MKIDRVPKALICSSNASPIPEMNDDMSITVITPTTTPMIVKNERSLLPRSVSNAILRFSRNLLVAVNILIGPQRFYRVQPGRLPRRKQSRENSDGGRHAYCDKCRPPRDTSRENELRDQKTE